MGSSNLRTRLEYIANATAAKRVDASESEAEAVRAFEADMAPICEAVATAIRAKDLAAFEGLKAMFAPMLAEANAEPALAQVLQRQIGEALLSSFAEPAPKQGRGVKE